MFDLSHLNTFHLPAVAQKFISIDTPLQVKELPKDQTLFLGQGSNILFRSQAFPLVAANKLTGFKVIADKDNEVEVEFSSGHSWHDAVMWAVDQGFSGMENMAYIPGTVGAAAIGNIGAYGGNQEDIFVSLTAFDLHTRKQEVFTKSDMNFSYRESIFKRELFEKYFVTSVTYRLSKTAHLETSYASRYESLSGQLEQVRPKDPNHPYTIKEVAQAVTSLRRIKLPDISVLGSAGSFFKNPTIPKTTYLNLKSRLDKFQGYPPDKLQYQDEQEWLDKVDKVKIPAGRLLDELGWKGKKIGHVGTFEKHALIIVNYGGATGGEIFEFAENMRTDVQKNFDVPLHYEVIVL
jgi:UDP-N-acetylmuramate dehydrogenase